MSGKHRPVVKSRSRWHGQDLIYCKGGDLLNKDRPWVIHAHRPPSVDFHLGLDRSPVPLNLRSLGISFQRPTGTGPPCSDSKSLKLQLVLLTQLLLVLVTQLLLVLVTQLLVTQLLLGPWQRLPTLLLSLHEPSGRRAVV